MFTVDWAIELLDLIVSTFGGVWEWLNSPVIEIVGENTIVGSLVALVIPDAIGNLTPIALMLGVSLGVYLGLQLAAWILSWLPLV